MEQLTGWVVVITGGASGVGRGIAEAFAEAGARLVLADVNENRLKGCDWRSFVAHGFTHRAGSIG